MKILSSSFLNHDSSISILKDGKIVEYVLAERKSRKKHDGEIIKLFDEIVKNRKDHRDIDFISNSFFNEMYMHHLENYLFDLKKSINLESDFEDHHFCHAHCGYYSSQFNDALCIVMDGSGSCINVRDKNGNIGEYLETLSVYEFHNGKINDILFKELVSYELVKRYSQSNVISDNKLFDYDSYSNNQNKNEKISLIGPNVNNPLSVGLLYELVTMELGYRYSDCGKVMGLAQYKNHEDDLPENYSGDEWRKKVEVSHKLQNITEKRVLDIVKEYVDKTGIKNVVLTGGVFLNCVSNYNLIKEMPEVKFHIDPICSDNGISIGRSLISHIRETESIPSRIENSYLGHKEDNKLLKKKIKKSNLNYIENIKYGDIVNILLAGEIVSLFQGRSESGQRSLGNRSLLFDPRIKNGRTIVNRIKKREDFRPFAASIMLEYATDWFNLLTLNESPTMSFAVDAYERAVKEVPAVIHADNTCRIQTVSKDQNHHFYNLISAFYNSTGVPMLLNTSFNLAGEPLVETFEDSLKVMENSELRYIYLPEIDILISK
jgi:carbamoyltransferase